MSTITGSSVLNDVYDPLTHTLKIAGGGGALPVGLATEAKQDDAIALLTTIDDNSTPGTPQTGVDATGADAYATIVTAATAKTHIMVTNLGEFGAIISLNGGTTDHLRIPGASGVTLDSVAIASGAAIQAKNMTAGSNYANLTITIW